MKAYLQAFVIFKPKDLARLLPMAEFVYNNVKNASTNHTPFKLNSKYHPWLFYKKNIDTCSMFKLVDKLLAEIQKPMTVCRKNLYYAQEL